MQQADDFIKSTLGDTSMQYAIVLNNKAMLYQVINKIDDAETIMLKALDIVKANSKEESPTHVRFKVNLALLYQAQKRFLSLLLSATLPLSYQSLHESSTSL